MSRRKKKERERIHQIRVQRFAEKRNRMCENKIAYQSELEAESYAKMFEDDRYRKKWQRGEKFRAYFCPCCSKWHLSSKEKQASREIFA